MSTARIDIGSQMTKLAQSHRTFSALTAWAEISNTYRSNGVAGSIFVSLPALLSKCAPLTDIRAPEPGGPAPGDLAVFQPQDHSQLREVAVFVDNGEVSFWSSADSRFHLLPVAALDGAGTTNQSMLYASKGSVTACRIIPAFWAHGHDDTGIAPGQIELVDPAVAARQIDWVEEHPRDPDQSLGHAIWRRVVGVVSWISGAVGFVFTNVMHFGDWALHHIPIVGGVVLGAIGILTKRFDATGLHRVLSYILGEIPLFTFKAVSLVAGMAGLQGVEKTFRNAAEGMIRASGFVVTLLTGLEGKGESTVGGVGIALASDILLVAKPAVAGVRLLEAGISGRFGMATTLDRMSDLIMVRPLAWFGPKFAASQALATRVAIRIGDLFSWVWRPSSILNDSVDQLSNALKILVTRSPAHSLEDWAAAMEKVNQVLHAASGSTHVDQLATTGTLPTVHPPRRLRPHQFLGFED